MKTKVLVFTTNNARMLTNPGSIPDGALVNPDLSAVRGVPTHFWKLGAGGKVVEMSRPEKMARLAHHEKFGVDNAHEEPKSAAKAHILRHWYKYSLLAGYLAGALTTAVAWRVLG